MIYLQIFISTMLWVAVLFISLPGTTEAQKSVSADFFPALKFDLKIIPKKPTKSRKTKKRTTTMTTSTKTPESTTSTTTTAIPETTTETTTGTQATIKKLKLRKTKKPSPVLLFCPMEMKYASRCKTYDEVRRDNLGFFFWFSGHHAATGQSPGRGNSGARAGAGSGSGSGSGTGPGS